MQPTLNLPTLVVESVKEVTTGCMHHATREKMVPLGQGWVHRAVEDSDECWHKDHKSEKCDGKNERCKDYAEKEIPE